MEGPDLNKKYTYKDYLTWNDGKRWEIIEGKVYPLEFGNDPKNMSPAPGRRHQEINRNLTRIIGNFLVGKTCQLFGVPFDVRFIEDDLSETVLQPDISVFCVSTKLDDKGATGAPDWIIEIIFPSTEFRDKTMKAFLYQKHGVKSYWLIDPPRESVATLQLMPDGRFDVPLEYKEGSVPTIIEGFSISFEDIFAK